MKSIPVIFQNLNKNYHFMTFFQMNYFKRLFGFNLSFIPTNKDDFLIRPGYPWRGRQFFILPLKPHAREI